MLLVHHLPSRQRVLVSALAALGVVGLCAFVAHKLFSLGGDGHLWDTWLYNIVILAAAGLVVARALLMPGERTAWLLVAAALGLWAGGFLSYTLIVAPRDPIPYPSVSDAAWLGFYPTLLCGLVLLVRTRRPGVRRGLWLDAVVGTLALASVIAALLLEPIVQSTGGSLRAVIVNLGYPLGDLLILGFVLAVFAASGWRPGRVWVIIGAALALEVLADTIYLHQAASGTFEAGGLLAALWLVVALALAAAAWAAPSRPSAARQVSRWNAGVPLVFGLIGLAVTTVDSIDSVGTASLVLATATVVLSFVRAATTVAELTAVSHSRELLERHASILDSAGEGIYALDAEGRVTFGNRAAGQLTGRAPEQLVGQIMHDVVQHSREDGSAYPVAGCPVSASLSSGVSVQVTDEVYWRADGTCFPVDYTATPLRENGRVTGVVVVFHDVSERREVQRIKDEFTSVVSHELRTPLTSIRGSLGLLAGGMAGQLSQQGQRMVDIAVDNSDRLVRLINDILDIERMQSGAVVIDRRACAVGPLVDEAAALMDATARDAGVILEVACDDAVLWADRDRIVQTLSNLLSNAIKFSPPAGRIRLTAGRRDDGDVLVRIADEGRGIPHDKLEAVFNPFEQVDASDARDKGGTGLGLAICRSIVEQHGGRIWADSRPGEGATFSIALPALPAATAGPSVLVCDDDPVILDRRRRAAERARLPAAADLLR